MNLVDFLLFLGFAGGIALGFYRGLIKQLLGLLALYVSLVASTLTYPYLSPIISRSTQTAPLIADLVAFLFLLAVFDIIANLMLNTLIEEPRAKRFGTLDLTGGMLIGLLNACIWGAVIVAIVRSATATGNWLSYEGLRTFLHDQTTHSLLANIFRTVFRIVMATIKPWLFGGDLPILLRNAI